MVGQLSQLLQYLVFCLHIAWSVLHNLPIYTYFFQNYYNLINQKAREAELSLIQFQYDGPLPTVQPNGSQ